MGFKHNILFLCPRPQVIKWRSPNEQYLLPFQSSISARRFPRGNQKISLAAIVLGRPTKPSQNVGESANMIGRMVVGNTDGATLTTASVHYLNITRRLAKKSGGNLTTTKSVQKYIEKNITAMSVRVKAMAAGRANVGVLAINHCQVVNQDGAT